MCRKEYSLNTSDIYFVLALPKPSLPPWAGRSGHVCVCVCAFRGNPSAQTLVGLLYPPYYFSN